MKTAKEYFEGLLITDAQSVVDKNAIKFSRFDLIRFAEAYAEYCHKLEEQSMDNYIANTEITPLTKDDFKQMDKEEMPVMPDDDIKLFAQNVWTGTANSFRLYPNNKHTFVEFWEIYGTTIIGYFKSHSPVSVERKQDKGEEMPVMRIVDFLEYLHTNYKIDEGSVIGNVFNDRDGLDKRDYSLKEILQEYLDDEVLKSHSPVSVESKVTDEITQKCYQCGNESSKELHCRECGNNFPPDIKERDRKADLIKFSELLEENTIDIVYCNDEQDMNYLINEYLNSNTNK